MAEDFSHYLLLINQQDPDDPLLSSTPLGQRLASIPLELTDPPILINLCQDLNIEELIPTENGLFRDYRGFAETIGYPSNEIEGYLKRLQNPAMIMVKRFATRSDRPSIQDMIKVLEKIERFDLIDDLLPALIRIVEQQQGGLDQLMQGQDSNPTIMLTIDDTSNTTTMYDAFICFAPEDSNYANQLRDFLESKLIRVATSDQFLAGQFQHDALTKMIDSRCNKVLIVVTPNFFNSSQCDLERQYTSSLALSSSKPKIIPVICERCSDLGIFKFMSNIDLTNKNSQVWQLERLHKSLMTPSFRVSPSPTPIVEVQHSAASITELSQSVSQISFDDTNSRTNLVDKRSSRSSRFVRGLFSSPKS